ncbi:MAG TPA: HEAT repeat domain-containing protein [Nitrosopumilaceae archaeon]|nr:HEAT repeat domain-containing protein [Nitrosopumilaceae archaeon]
MEVIPSSLLDLLSEMEEKYEKKDKEYFIQLLVHKNFVIRTRAVCILVDFGGEEMIPYVASVLKNDPNELVRHEAAFSLGQMCYHSGIKPLEDAVRNDPSFFVRHEAAIALGVIGSQDAKETLQKALEDSSEPVRESAIVALSNLQFMEKLSKNERFAKLTGG